MNETAATVAANEPSTLLVVAMGMITVFVVLICLIGIIKLLGMIMVSITGKSTAAAPAPVAVPQAAAEPQQGDKQKLVAAIAAAIAEDMGTDVNHLKIHSIRKL